MKEEYEEWCHSASQLSQQTGVGESPEALTGTSPEK